MRFIHVSADNNNAPVLNNLMNNNCVAVQYYMDGCHYCNLLKPHWAKMNSILKNQYQGDIIVARVNANAVSNVNNSTNISGYPTIRYLENGNNISEFKKMTYLNLVKYETIDQISVAKKIRELPYVDSERIGIWGWSFGGHMATNCLLKGNDIFSMGIAVAPVTNWRFYDTIYTERFMRTPQENPDGYDLNSPINYADKLKGKFLIIHGSADDNVHVQNTMRMVEALIQNDKQFEWMIYPDKNHGIYGGNTTKHLYTKMTNFILNNL